VEAAAAARKQKVVIFFEFKKSGVTLAPGRLALCWLLALAAILVAPLHAQTAIGSLHGMVTDPSGAAVVGAEVRLIAPEGNTLAAKSGRDGTYQFRNLTPGKYTLRVSAKGFEVFEAADINIAPAQSQKADASLSILVEQQNLEVTEQGPSLDVSSSNNATQMVLKGKDLEALADDPDELADDLQALAGPSVGPNGGQIYIDGFTGGQIPPKSSIREVRINQNPFSSEYDKLGYGRIEIFTKPGTDKWHGQFTVTGNTAGFNGKNPFASEEPSYNSELYSGNVGGPLGKKASFFLSVDQREIGDVAVVNAFVLNSELQQVPYSTTVPVPRTRTVISPRFDFQLTPTNTLSVRYQYWHDTDDNAGVGQFSLPSQGYSSTETEQSIQIGDTQLFGTKVVNETRFSYRRARSQQNPINTDTTVNVLGAFVSGGNASQYVRDNQDNYEFQNYTSILSGKHMIKFGARLRDGREANYADSNFNGTYTFDSLTAYQITQQGLANGLTPQQIRAAGGGASQFFVVQGRPSIGVNLLDLGLYVQDEWRWKPNLTISAGLRYEMQTDIADKNAWAPRIGFAWGIGRSNSPSPKTVLRAGWGIFYDRFDKMYVLIADRQNGINQTQYIINQPDFFPNVPPPDQIRQNAVFPTVYQTSPNLRAEYIQQVAVSLERQITNNANLAVSYLNSRGVHQYLTRNINAPFPNTYNPSDPNSGVRPFGDIGNIYQYESSGDMRQHQLIVNANWRLGSKLSFFGYYVLNYVNANTQGASSFPFDQYNLALSYGPTSYDTRNRVFIGGTWALPRKFRVSPFFVAQSSVPFNITTGQDYNGDSIFNDRPTFATVPNAPNVVVTKYGTFNTAPQPGQTYIPPYYGWGPGRWSLNLRVSKSISFGRETGSTRMTDSGPGPGGPPSGGGGGHGGGPGGGGPRGGFGGASSGPLSVGGGTSRRYTLTLSAIGRNIFNHVNVAPLTGNLTSPIFGEANALASGPYSSGSANRRIDFQAAFSF
jgi:hypothetical protein